MDAAIAKRVERLEQQLQTMRWRARVALVLAAAVCALELACHATTPAVAAAPRQLVFGDDKRRVTIDDSGIAIEDRAAHESLVLTARSAQIGGDVVDHGGGDRRESHLTRQGLSVASEKAQLDATADQINISTKARPRASAAIGVQADAAWVSTTRDHNGASMSADQLGAKVVVETPQGRQTLDK
jgi:hypothetical protein